MAQSPASAHRARLIREMSKELNSAPRPRPSGQSQNGGSAENTTMDFDPENEALMSTRQFDNTTQQLPELRASAQKYARYARREPSFVVDTSAMENAFPDFTQAGPSDSGNDSLSIEIGRGLKNGSNGSISKLGQSREYSSNAASSVDDDSFDLTLPGIGDYQVMYTPPNKPKPKKSSNKEKNSRSASLQRAAQAGHASSTQKKLTEASPPLTKMTEYGSSEEKQGSEIQRRALAVLRARVRDENDMSIMSDERPSILDLTTKNTRFGGGQATQAPTKTALPPKFSAAQDFSQKGKPGNQKNIDSHMKNATLTSSTSPATKQSFIIPDLPNISELVSGVFQDGTPVFSRDPKHRSSRFATASGSQKNLKTKPNHPTVQEIPVPQDEHDIYVSLQLLQDRVGELEIEGAETKANMTDLQQKNQLLEREKSESRKWRRSDSALGTTDGSEASDEAHKGSRRWTIEKTRIESNVRMLQQQLDLANQKASATDTTIRKLAKERDSAVAQLGIAYTTQEEIKAENESLRHENEKLKHENETLKDQNLKLEADLAHITFSQNDQGQKWQKLEEALRKKIHRRDEIVRKLRGIPQINEVSFCKQPERDQVKPKSNALASEQITAEAAKQGIPTQPKENTDRPIQEPLSTPRRGEQFQERQLPGSVKITRGKTIEAESLRKDLSKRRDDTALSDVSSDSEISEDSISEFAATRRGLRDTPGKSAVLCVEPDEVSEDLTYRSLIDSLKTAKFRKGLEQEGPVSMQQPMPDTIPVKQSADASIKIQPSTTKPAALPNVPLKSSMKDLTGRIDEANNTVPSYQNADENVHSKESTTHYRRHSEVSLLEQSQRRQGLGMEDMTSAFIIPDITIRLPVTEAKGSQNLSAITHQVFDDLAAHDGKNCTVCTRIIEEGPPHNHDKPAKTAIHIPKPTPVSERMPEPKPYEDEPTIRPSQPPPVALATVMKGLEDELAHLKIKLSRYQALHNQHDPSLGKRKRKAVHAKIEIVLHAIDTKSDQIYALYDVLEGQKADGHEIDEQEVENTLQSIGIDVSGLELRGGEVLAPDADKHDTRHAWEVSSDGSDDELPWEGIENTEGTAKTGGDSRRRSWA